MMQWLLWTNAKTSSSSRNLCDSSDFSKPSLNIWKFLVHVMLKPSLEDFACNSATMGDECNCLDVWILFSTALLGNWDDDWHFPVLWPQLHFPNLLTYWVQHFSSIIFRSLISSAGIPSPPLTLLAAVLPKAPLTSHSRMSDSEWETTPLWLSRSLKYFLYSSSVYSYHLFLISSASIKSSKFLSLFCPSLDEMFFCYFQYSLRELLSFPFSCFPLFF